MKEEPRGRKIERNVFRIGVALLIGKAVFLVVVAVARPAVFAKMIALISASLAGGHLTAIPAGLGLGFRPAELICFLSFFSLMWLLLIYSLVVKLSDRATGHKLIGQMVRDTHAIAHSQKARVGRFGMLGLAIFVWLPFPWTGSMVGAVIGLLMGMSTERIMFVVVPSMFLSITTWTVCFTYLFDLMARLEQWFSFALAACIILLALLLRFHRAHRRENETAVRPDS